MYVTPGFIDIHTHSDFTLLLDATAESFLKQGVTTQVIGNCGLSGAPLKKPEYLARNLFCYMAPYYPEWITMEEYLTVLEKNGLGTNVICLVGRNWVMGYKNQRVTKTQLKSMENVLQQALTEGAFGFSTGLEYFPGNTADEAEIIVLCKIVKNMMEFTQPM